MPFDPQVPVSGVVPAYADYTEAGGAIIPEADWDQWCNAAWRVVNDLTFGAAATTTTYLTEVYEAVLRAADACYIQHYGVGSESIGAYSATYAIGQKAYPYETAAMALHGTGLAHRGL